MRRAVLLPTPGDPFLVSYWLRHYADWYSALGTKLYVYISFPQRARVLNRLEADVEAVGGVVVRAALPGIAEDLRVEHGDALRAMLDVVEEELVFMSEDDLYIQEPHELDAAFHAAEEGLVIGEARGSMSMELVDAFAEQYPYGAGLWPYVVARRADLLAITERFGPRHWEPGDTVTGTGYTCREPCDADTFGAAAMELRSIRDVHDGRNRTMWHHAGSLSSGPFIAHENLVAQVGSAGGVISWSNRYSWWERFWREWPGGLESEHEAYGSALQAIAATLGV